MLSGVIRAGSKGLGAALHASVFRKCYLAWSSLVALLALAVLTASCGGGDARTAARANVVMPVPVSVSTADLRDMPYYLTGLGSVSAYYTVSVKSRVDGQIVEVNSKKDNS